MSQSLSLEALLTSPAGFGLTSATPLQRAITRAADGKPTRLTAEAIQKHFGGFEPPSRPDLVTLICGVRSGKSLIAGAASLHSALTADLTRLRPHERARSVIVAPTKQNADYTYQLLLGGVRGAPALKALLVGEPSDDGMTVRREDGRFVDIFVVAAHKGGVSIRGTWLTSFVLEEAAFFGTDVSGYVVNAEELLRSAQTRLVPGGQGWIISSPMGPEGLLFNLWKTHFGKPGKVLVVHAPTLDMNHVTINKDVVEEIRKRDPDAAAREYDAVWADSEASLIPATHLDDAMAETPLSAPYEEGHSYVAAMDPATRGNAWTLVVATKDDETPHQRVVLVRQWIGSKVKPLSPDAVLAEIALILKDYQVDRAVTDQHAADANRDIARRHGLYLYERTASREENIRLYENLATKLADGEVALPPDPVLRADLLAIRKKVSSRVTIVLPKTPDGRHCDYAPALALVLDLGCSEPVKPKPKPGTPEYYEMIRAEEKEAAKAQAARYARDEARELNKAIRRGDYSGLFDDE